MAALATPIVGAPLDRVEGREKVSGVARYAYEHEPENLAYGVLVQSTIANGPRSLRGRASRTRAPGGDRRPLA